VFYLLAATAVASWSGLLLIQSRGLRDSKTKSLGARVPSSDYMDGFPVIFYGDTRFDRYNFIARNNIGGNILHIFLAMPCVRAAYLQKESPDLRHGVVVLGWPAPGSLRQLR
jgi:hypothetical protein